MARSMVNSNSAESKQSTGQGFNILLVENDELVRAHLDQILEIAGYGVLSVGSCKEARHAASALVFPMMIIDRELGDGDGIDLIAEFRKLYGFNRAFVMLLTALDSEDEIARGLAAGADDYLSKTKLR